MENIFSIKEKVAIVTGGGGVLGGSIAKNLLKAGSKIVLIDIRKKNLDDKISELKSIGGEVLGFICNVLNVDDLHETAMKIVKKWDRIDILVNCAGGNIPGATLSSDQTIFDMEIENWERVVSLNQNGTVYPCLIFGKVMSEQKEGSIVNISSMATYSAITRVPGYSVAKMGINIFTQWLATELANKFGERIRVNAIAPGFFIGDQNRSVLINTDGTLTKRSEKILAKTPMGRFGNINELSGAVQFLCSQAARFITGIILPIDGGFSSFSGV